MADEREVFSWGSSLSSLDETGYSVALWETIISVSGCNPLLGLVVASSSALSLQIKGKNPKDLWLDLFNTVKINASIKRHVSNKYQVEEEDNNTKGWESLPSTPTARIVIKKPKN